MGYGDDKFEQSDVTRWGITAMAVGATAILSISLSAILPQGALGGLHSSGQNGGSLNLLRAQVDQLRTDQREILSETDRIRSQFQTAERGRDNVLQRVDALETSIPMLLEVVPPDADIDRSLLTASVGAQNSITRDVDGGSVTMNLTPLFDAPVLTPPQALPQNLNTRESDQSVARSEVSTPSPTSEGMEISRTEYGLAVGTSLSAKTDQEIDESWSVLENSIGTLVFGLTPAISDPIGDGNLRIILGPISDYAEAEMLCQRIAQAGIQCLPVQYAPEIAAEIATSTGPEPMVDEMVEMATGQASISP